MMHRVPHLLSFYALSFEAAVPGSGRKMFLCELFRKGKGAGRAGPEALQRAGVPGRYLQPLPGRTGRVGAAVLARRSRTAAWVLRWVCRLAPKITA